MSVKHPARPSATSRGEKSHDLEWMTRENDQVPPSKGTCARAPAAQRARNAPDRNILEPLRRPRELRMWIFPPACLLPSVAPSKQRTGERCGRDGVGCLVHAAIGQLCTSRCQAVRPLSDDRGRRYHDPATCRPPRRSEDGGPTAAEEALLVLRFSKRSDRIGNGGSGGFETGLVCRAPSRRR